MWLNTLDYSMAQLCNLIGQFLGQATYGHPPKNFTAVSGSNTQAVRADYVSIDANPAISQ